MGRQQLAPGVRLLLDEQMHVVREMLTDGRCQLENLGLGGHTVLSQTELLDAWATGRLRFEVLGRTAQPIADRPLVTAYTQADFEVLPSRQRETAWRRYRQLMALYQHSGAPVGTHIPRRLVVAYVQQTAQPPATPSVASLERWLAAFADSGSDIRALLPHSHLQGGKGHRRLEATVEQIVTDILEACKREPRHRTPDQIYTRILNQIAETNRNRTSDRLLNPPSRATLYRRLEQTGVQTVLRRLPSRAQQQKTADVEPGPRVTRILERVEIDHTPLHLFVVDLEDRLPIGRPTLTLATDCYSKMPFGFEVSFHPGSYLTVMRCLRHGILPKPDCQQLYDTAHPFPVYGLPETVVVDRGREFVGNSLLDALGMLGIIREVMPGRTPWYKGSIERFFRTQNQALLEGVPGYTFSNCFTRADYDPQQDACLSLSAFYELLHVFLLDVYAQRWHEGIQDIPARRWERSLQTGMMPCLYHDAEELRILLCASEERTLTRQGIEWETLYYHSADLARLRVTASEKRVRFRYDPDDLGQIYVYDPSSLERHWLIIPAVNQDYARGLSLYKHRVIRQMVLADKRSVDIYALAQAKAQLQELVAHEFMLTRKARGRKRAARFLEGNTAAVPSSTAVAPPLDSLPADQPLPDAAGWYGDYGLPSE
ncbi:MAG: transposase [Aggregatilineales bacterium]